MANITTNSILYDNNQNTTVLITGLNDGSPNDTLLTVVDLSTLTYLPPFVAIRWMDWDVNGGVVKLFWDEADPYQFETLASIGNRDYTFISGLQNPGRNPLFGNSGGNGNILLSTVGFDVGSSYTIRMKLRKKFHSRFPRLGNEDQHTENWPQQQFGAQQNPNVVNVTATS